MAKRLLAAVFTWTTFRTTTAKPETAFPFNSQVPAVARVGEQYSFRFSSSTFAPTARTFTYSLSNAPSWLNLDSATRTLSGTPTKEDAGAVQFVLTAGDDTGVTPMPCTLVVSTDPAPRLEGDISAELSSSANLSSTDPAVVTLRPSTAFSFVFQPSSFIDLVPRQLYYYATLADHTPLPSWLSFDMQRLTFSGRAPELSAFPQSWDVQLIASDVAGFSAATAAFTIAVSTQQLVFVPAEQEVSVVSGTALSFTRLGAELYRDGALLGLGELVTADANPLPAWLAFDSKTLALTGLVPTERIENTFTVTVFDRAGNKAQATVNLVQGNGSLLLGKIKSLTAYSGRPFEYTVPEALLLSPEVSLELTLPAQATWLSFNDVTRTLHGTVPDGTALDTLAATLRASLTGYRNSESQPFTITIRDVATSPGTPDPASNTNPVIPANNADVAHLSKGAIAAIVTCSILGVVILAVLLFMCSRKRKKNTSYVDESRSSCRPSISRPVPSSPLHPRDSLGAASERDSEKLGEQTVNPTEGPPQIGRLSALGQRFSRISRVSSLGPGQEAIMADPNIMEWGGESEMLRRPHESFQVTSKMAALSKRWSRASDSQKAFQRQKHESENSFSLLEAHLASPRQKPGFSHKKDYKLSRGDMSPRLHEGSQASVNTSVLSEKPSLPLHRPAVSAAFGSLPVLPAGHANKRNTVRLVDREARESNSEGFKDKHDSYMRSYRSRRSATPVFANALGSTRQSRKPSRSYGSFSTTSSKLREHRLRESRNRLSTQQESSPSEKRSNRNMHRLSARLRSAFSPEYPKVIDVQRNNTARLQDERDKAGESSRRTVDESRIGKSQAGDSDDWHTSMSSNDSDMDSGGAMPAWLAEAQLPRHQRDWVHPFEASPTPEPPPKSHLRLSRSFHTASSRQSSQAFSQESPSSPLASAPLVAKRTTLSHPMRMVSKDSLAAVRARPRLVDASSRFPARIEEGEHILDDSQIPADGEDATVGSEMWLEMTMNEIRSPHNTSRSSTVKSHDSGQPVFL